MDDGWTTSSRNEGGGAALLVSFALAVFVVACVVFGGLAVSYWLGGRDWAKVYGIGIGILVVLGVVYGMIYSLMRLLVNHAQGQARSMADLLYAHSQSGAQQARAVTEVVRGVNSINAADAKTQQQILSNYANLGANYEKRLADLAYQNQMLKQQLQLQAPKEEDDLPRFAQPSDDDDEVVVYKLPKVS